MLSIDPILERLPASVFAEDTEFGNILNDRVAEGNIENLVTIARSEKVPVEHRENVVAKIHEYFETPRVISRSNPWREELFEDWFLLCQSPVTKELLNKILDCVCLSLEEQPGIHRSIRWVTCMVRAVELHGDEESRAGARVIASSLKSILKHVVKSAGALELSVIRLVLALVSTPKEDGQKEIASILREIEDILCNDVVPPFHAFVTMTDMVTMIASLENEALLDVYVHCVVRAYQGIRMKWTREELCVQSEHSDDVQQYYEIVRQIPDDPWCVPILDVKPCYDGKRWDVQFAVWVLCVMRVNDEPTIRAFLDVASKNMSLSAFVAGVYRLTLFVFVSKIDLQKMVEFLVPILRESDDKQAAISLAVMLLTNEREFLFEKSHAGIFSCTDQLGASEPPLTVDTTMRVLLTEILRVMEPRGNGERQEITSVVARALCTDWAAFKRDAYRNLEKFSDPFLLIPLVRRSSKNELEWWLKFEHERIMVGGHGDLRPFIARRWLGEMETDNLAEIAFQHSLSSEACLELLQGAVEHTHEPGDLHEAVSAIKDWEFQGG